MFTPPRSPTTPPGTPPFISSYRQRAPPPLVRRRPVRRLNLDDDAISRINLSSDNPVQQEYTISDDFELANRPLQYFNPECAICMEPLEHDDNICEIVNCHHTFHCSCLSRWRNHKNTCPTCKQPIDQVVRKNPNIEFPSGNNFGRHKKKLNQKQLLSDLKYILK
jgi:hypothetical protein